MSSIALLSSLLLSVLAAFVTISELVSFIFDIALTYPVISIFFHCVSPAGVLTFIRVFELLINQELSSFCFVIGISSVIENRGSFFGFSILRNHSRPPPLVEYISFTPNLSIPEVTTWD